MKVTAIVGSARKKHTYCAAVWFVKNYYYPARLNPVKKLTGRFFDFLFILIYKKKKFK